MWEVLSPVLVATTAVVIIGLEHLFPYERGQRLLRAGFFTDFFWYTLVQSYVLGLVIKAIIVSLDAHTGWSRLHLVTSWPVVGQLAFFWVTHDLYIYWFHRLQHRSKLLWRIHEAHHSGKDVDWLAGSRSHSLEILINQTIEYAPIVLLGAHPDVALMKGVLDAAWGMYIHANIGVRSGWLQFVFNGPEMHRWHHADLPDRRNVNFATKIALWDWVGGTAYLPQSKPRAYGLWGGAPFPERPGWRGALTDYFWQHAWAFRGAGFLFTSPPGDFLFTSPPGDFLLTSHAGELERLAPPRLAGARSVSSHAREPERLAPPRLAGARSAPLAPSRQIRDVEVSDAVSFEQPSGKEGKAGEGATPSDRAGGRAGSGGGG